MKFISSHCVCVYSLWFSTYKIKSFENRVLILCFQTGFYISSSGLLPGVEPLLQSWVEVVRGDSIVLFLTSGWKLTTLCQQYVSCRFFIGVFQQVQEVPFWFCFVRYLNVKTFVKYQMFFSASIEVTMLLLSFILLMQCFTLFFTRVCE